MRTRWQWSEFFGWSGSGTRSFLLARAALAAVMIVIPLMLATGCAEQAGTRGQPVLKVVAASQEEFDRNYGDYIAAAFPELKVTVIETNAANPVGITAAQYEQLLQAEQPDLICFSYNPNLYRELAASGFLTDLSARMQADGFAESDYYAGMIEGLRIDGTLYGLAPTFQTSSLVYNEELFRKYGITPPRNGITSEELYALANEFAQAGSGRDDVAGLHLAHVVRPFDHLWNFSMREGMTLYNMKTGKVTIDTPLWERFVGTLLRGYKLGTFALRPGESDGVLDQTFNTGKAAMSIEVFNTSELFAFAGVGQERAFRVGKAVGPLGMDSPNRSDDIYFPGVVAIPASAKEPEQAWTVTKFLMSDYMAKVWNALSNSNLPANRAYMDYNDDPVLPGLYELLPKPAFPLDTLNGDYGPKFMTRFGELVNRVFEDAVAHGTGAKEVVRSLQSEGQKLMDAHKLAPGARKSGG
ncbi:ABC transporter substrate-binding protein [Paenibacillus methanolicus]|uniref:ABC-type glycerol-3-phosphate transport system substrate-binding protein n=1 Tax=Paenibacillus methanolicus TaxID=582686 RepID=A0A5S5BZR6_9BACL|nr:extracellular solute-binding protein [Paenibacillus methanolicus]TYP71858.1 ABC-type glycerol-3-phosphate transport system substrate-binding protein [Paenibacillus methanolicus]